MRRQWTVIAGILMIGLVLAACGQTHEVEEPEEIPEETEDIAVVTPPEEPEEEQEPEEDPEPVIYPHTQPLTGMGTEEKNEARPVMVLIENSPAARPQSGLDSADIVYEVLAEGEITRFLAVYQSESPETIGPVRSIRPYMVEIGDGLDALIVHAGWSQEAMNMLSERRLPHFDEIYGDGAYYWRSEDRKAPHNLYTSIELIRKGADNKSYRKNWNDPGFKFVEQGERPEIEGDSAAKININYIGGYFVDYHYDVENDVFERHMLGEPHVDPETENVLHAANVIVAKTSHRIVDNIGRRHINVEGSGEGYLFQQGKARKIAWQHHQGALRVTQDGEEIPLLPGKTWIHYIPLNSTVAYQ